MKKESLRLKRATHFNCCAMAATSKFYLFFEVVKSSNRCSFVRTKDLIHVVLDSGYCHRVESSLFVTCTNGHFKMSDCRKRISVEETTCNQKQEPLIVRLPTPCSPIGVDGRTDGLDTLVRVSIFFFFFFFLLFFLFFSSFSFY